MVRSGWKLSPETKRRMSEAPELRFAVPPTREEILARLRARTIETTEGCWAWQGKKTPTGYGQLKIQKRYKYVHRVAWELLKGAIPEGQLIRHRRCDNPSCWRPSHLKPGTQRENMKDRAIKGRHSNTLKTHCKHGHAFTKANTYIDPRRRRNCLTCRRRIDRERRTSK